MKKRKLNLSVILRCFIKPLVKNYMKLALRYLEKYKERLNLKLKTKKVPHQKYFFVPFTESYLKLLQHDFVTKTFFSVLSWCIVSIHSKAFQHNESYMSEMILDTEDWRCDGEEVGSCQVYFSQFMLA